MQPVYMIDSEHVALCLLGWVIIVQARQACQLYQGVSRMWLQAASLLHIDECVSRKLGSRRLKLGKQAASLMPVM